MSSPSDPFPRLGRYQVINRIASGGMAEVFLARATGAMGFQRLVALKLIHANFTRDQEFVKMFIDEARIAMHLHHRNIVQVIDLDQVGDTYFIAMEYVNGVNVYDLYERHSARDSWVEVPLALYIVAEACKGLHFAHTRTGPDGRPMGIVHRDISPQNVLLSFEGEVKITDFGIATAAERLHHTAAGIVKGKYAYMAPERLEEKPVDGRVDVFAAGVLLYELLVGENPFAGSSAVETIEAVLAKEVPPPSSRGAPVNPHLDAIVAKALAKDPDERFENAQALADALTEFAMDMTFARKEMASGDSALASVLLEMFPEKAKRPLEAEDPASLELPGVVSVDAPTAGSPAATPEPLAPPQAEEEEDIDAPTVLRMSPVEPEELMATTTSAERVADSDSRTLAITSPFGAEGPGEDEEDGLATTMAVEPASPPRVSPQGPQRVDPSPPQPRPEPRPEPRPRVSAPPAGPAQSPAAPPSRAAYPRPSPARASAPNVTASEAAGGGGLTKAAWALGALAAVAGVLALVLDREPPRAEISIRTRPSGARVTINGALQPEATPLLAKVTGNGPVVVELNKDGFEPMRRELQLRPGETLELNPALVPSTGSVVVTPSPPSARVKIDGIDRGSGKVMVRGLPFGREIQVFVEADGFAPQTVPVQLSAEDPKISLRINLARTR